MLVSIWRKHGRVAFVHKAGVRLYRIENWYISQTSRCLAFVIYSKPTSRIQASGHACILHECFNSQCESVGAWLWSCCESLLGSGETLKASLGFMQA